MLSRIKVPHYAYLILVGCCLTNVGGFSLVYDIAGVYLVPVSTGLGISSADVALWLTADGIISVVSMPIAGILLRNRRMNLFMAGGTLLAAAGVFGFSLCSEPWHFALCGCLTGLGMPYLYGIAQVTLIGNWFSVERQGRMLGIVMACQGLSAALWAPFFTLLIQGVGFRLAYRINALLILVIVLPWTLFVFRGSPAQKGLGPCCGRNEGQGPSMQADGEVGVDFGKAPRTAGFWFALIASCAVCIGMGFNSHQQAVAVEFFGGRGIDLAASELYGGFMMSAFAVGAVVGDMAFGFLLDRIGIKKTFRLFLLVFVLSFAVYYVAQSFLPLVFCASFMLGTHNGLASVGYPLLLRRLFGGREFSRIYSIVNMCCSFFGGLTTMAIALACGFLGGYAPVFLAAILFASFVAFFSFKAIDRIGSYEWVDGRGERAASDAAASDSDPAGAR